MAPGNNSNAARTSIRSRRRLSRGIGRCRQALDRNRRDVSADACMHGCATQRLPEQWPFGPRQRDSVRTPDEFVLSVDGDIGSAASDKSDPRGRLLFTFLLDLSGQRQTS